MNSDSPDSIYTWYIIESRRGMLIMGTNYGQNFALWTERQLAEDMCKNYQGELAHYVSTMESEELIEHLEQFRSNGMRYVILNRDSAGNNTIVPIDEAIEMCSRRIALRQAMDDTFSLMQENRSFEFDDEDISSFFAQQTSTWNELPDDAFRGVSDQVALSARAADKEQLAMAAQDLLRVMHERRDKLSFAYQYSLWLNDFTETMCHLLKNPTGQTKETHMMTVNLFKNAIHYKLSAMQRWYHLVFTGTPETDMPDKEMLQAANDYQATL